MGIKNKKYWRTKLIIRRATRKNLDLITELTYNAFQNYPLFNVSTNKEKLHKTLHFLLYLNTLANINDNDCYVCVDGKELVASFILKKPEHHHISFGTYIKIGGWQLPFKCSPKLASNIMNNLSRSDAIMPEKFKNYWYLDTLVVSPDYQGQKIGSKTLQEVMKMVLQQGGKKLCLITNTEINSIFYQKNGFKEVTKQSFNSFGQINDTWVFEQEV
ncbi:GNAT family N-acetyltransferase [Leuconostoc suionicum]|uniref:GNAT family N-acetyltransferase n=1 Tax=Leuconostoc suionicum TaxID=1511761 RepID=UPI00233F295D|nr:GNAT family N-acetyltransferase [Leuconostoc suionicum]MDC2816700.1 GNAT family N-acetyltransferase [Leuconostoc suionicum]